MQLEKRQTLGWSNGNLIEWVNLIQPTDCIQDFDFYGDRPNGVELPALGILRANEFN